MNLTIEKANEWLKKNASSYFVRESNLCCEVYVTMNNKPFLVYSDNDTKIILERSINLKSNQKFMFPIKIDICLNTVVINSKKQGNLQTFPNVIKNELVVENCELLSLRGDVNSCYSIFAANNQIENLDGLPNCQYLDVSFNPIKDFQVIKNRQMKSLTLSLSHMTDSEIFVVLEQLINSNIVDINISDSIWNSKHKILGLGAENIHIKDGVKKYCLNQSIVRAMLLEKYLISNISINDVNNNENLVKF